MILPLQTGVSRVAGLPAGTAAGQVIRHELQDQCDRLNIKGRRMASAETNKNTPAQNGVFV